MLAAGIGAVGCSSTEDANILSTEITPITEVYEWPLERVENRPSSGFELVQIINDDSYGCSIDFEGEITCKTTYDNDFFGYNRRSTPIDSSTAPSLELDRREFVGNLEIPPLMDTPNNTGDTQFSAESFYDIELVYTVGDSGKPRICSDRLLAVQFDESAARKALSGEVTYSDSWGNKYIQFKKDGDQLLRVDC